MKKFLIATAAVALTLSACATATPYQPVGATSAETAKVVRALR